MVIKASSRETQGGVAKYLSLTGQRKRRGEMDLQGGKDYCANRVC